MFISAYGIRDVHECRIISDEDEWASDHFPIRTRYCLPASSTIRTELQSDDTPVPRYPRIEWDNPHVKQMYSSAINKTLCEKQFFKAKLDEVESAPDAQKFVDDQCEHLVQTMHNACDVIQTSNNDKKRSKPRKVPWWSNNCTIARDRTRFWRHLWLKSDKNRNCHVYNVYKHTKNLYRIARRNAVNNFHQSNFKLLSNLFKSGNCKQFWNKL